MKKVLFLIALVSVSLSVFSQKSGLKGTQTVSVSYGLLPSTELMDVYSTLALPFLSSKTGNEWGAATLGYNYYLTNHISVGAQIVYSSSKTKIAETSYKNNYISIMPDVRYSWFNQSWFSLYSRVGAGVLIRHINYTEKIDSENDTKFAYQISPIGLDFGKTIIGFAEFGLGVSGTIIVGARYRF